MDKAGRRKGRRTEEIGARSSRDRPLILFPARCKWCATGGREGGGTWGGWGRGDMESGRQGAFIGSGYAFVIPPRSSSPPPASRQPCPPYPTFPCTPTPFCSLPPLPPAPIHTHTYLCPPPILIPPIYPPHHHPIPPLIPPHHHLQSSLFLSTQVLSTSPPPCPPHTHTYIQNLSPYHHLLLPSPPSIPTNPSPSPPLSLLLVDYLLRI